MSRFWKYIITSALTLLSIYSLFTQLNIQGITDLQLRIGNFVNKTTGEVTSTITGSPILSAILYFGVILVILLLAIVAIFMLIMMIKRG